MAYAGPPPPVHTYELSGAVTATVNQDGSLLVQRATGSVPLLLTEVVPLVSSRRTRHDDLSPFVAEVAEGAPNGQRGFSTHRDDDGDGLVDEDPLDGQDNDGDGRVDEDFAAISDAMVVVHQDGYQGGGRAAHLEYYHWSYQHLRATVFLSAKGSPGLNNGGTYRLVLGDHDWRATTLTTVRHDLAGRKVAGRCEGYVAQPAGPEAGCGANAGLWLGVILLNESAARPVALSGGVMDIKLGDKPVNLAICVADSWLQLNTMLNEATRVQAGLQDKITGQKAPWIVPPRCAKCRLSDPPDFAWRQTADGELILSAHILPERGAAIDPDLFLLADQALGAPREIIWQPDGGQAVARAWTCMNSALLDRPHDRLSNPYGQIPGLLGHQAAGYLGFVFGAGPDFSLRNEKEVQGRYLDGRSFAADLTPDSRQVPAERDDPSPGVRKSEPRISLSPKLLEGYPNPFRDFIQLRFVVPATQGEAFVWGENQAPPANVNLAAPVAWRSGVPSVSVKIYSLNGQELVTLYSGSQGPGSDTVQWDGTDSYGRQVASGTYFCKLQMDKYSVTRRLVYLR